VFVGGIVVDDGMDHFSHRDLRLDRIEEADELLMAVTLHVAADDSAVEDVESREQRGGAVAFVIVRHRRSAARLHRQPRLGAVERLDLALLAALTTPDLCLWRAAGNLRSVALRVPSTSTSITVVIFV